MRTPPSTAHRPSSPCGPRTLAVAGLAHALHDGYTDLIYVLLPIWQTQFGLGYGLLALMRGLYAGLMAALQVPAGRLAERLGGRVVLALGTVLAAFGYALAGFSGDLIGLCAGLALSGAGSSTQHPTASAAVARAYGIKARGPLGTYNFTGDLGKAALPAATSLLLALMPWRQALEWLAVLGLAVAGVVIVFMPPVATVLAGEKISTDAKEGNGRGGFAILFVLGVLDTAARMGLLTFLPFLLQAKGAALPTVGFAPVLYGVVGDLAGPSWGAALTAGTALLTWPVALRLAPHLRPAATRTAI